jgi:hypothetical protein
MTGETPLKHRIQLAISSEDTRFWNNPVGEAWLGKAVRQPNGSFIILHPKRVVYGLCPGSSDLIGAVSRIVTPNMVGKRIAIFAGVEVKTDDGIVSDKQERFISTIQGLGGIAGIARSPEEALRIISVDIR